MLHWAQPNHRSD
jgi:hypothetical protein